MTHNPLLFLHLISVAIWVGGMFFAYFCLRPAAVEILEPPQRLPLWLATFKRFFKVTAVAVAVIVVTGLIMLLQVGFKYAPIGWHIMLTTGLLMTATFIYVYAILYPRLCKQCKTSTWPDAGETLNKIRKMVGMNLALSVITIAAAAFSR
jgi:uncharacterized membrane protein